MFFGTRQSTMINYIVTKEAGGWQWSVEPFSGFQKLFFSKAGSEDIPSGNQTSQWLCHKPEGLIPNFGCGIRDGHPYSIRKLCQKSLGNSPD